MQTNKAQRQDLSEGYDIATEWKKPASWHLDVSENSGFSSQIIPFW